MNALDHNPTISDPIADADIPLLPPRFWWLKRIAVVIIAVLIVFTILFFWVEYRSRALLETRIAEWKAAGQPVDPQDFNRKTRLPDERNAAKLYNDAAASFTWPADIRVSIGLNDLRDLDEYPEEARKVVKANLPMLELLREAGKLDDADWGTFVTSPMGLFATPNLSGPRQCARIGSLAAEVAARDGDGIEAIRRVHDTLRMGNALGQHATTLLEGLVSTSITTGAVLSLEHVLPALESSIAPHDLSGEFRAELQSLIDALLDERVLAHAWRRGMFFERAICIDNARALADGSMAISALVPAPPGRLTFAPIQHTWRIIARPMWRRDGVRNAEHLSRYSGIDFNASYQKACAIRLDADSEEVISFEAISPISAYARLNATQIFDVWFRSIAQRRMAACALAIHLYQWDHGQRPDQLVDLVPECLTSIPIDSFDTDAGPIRYLPDATPARLYSVGLNGIDEDGDYDLRPRGGFRWREKDLVFRLDHEPDDSDSDE